MHFVKKQMITIFLAVLLSLSLIGSISAAYDEKMHQGEANSVVEIPFEQETEIFTTMLNQN